MTDRNISEAEVYLRLYGWVYNAPVVIEYASQPPFIGDMKP